MGFVFKTNIFFFFFLNLVVVTVPTRGIVVTVVLWSAM